MGNADGRIMIAPERFTQANPNYGEADEDEWMYGYR